MSVLFHMYSQYFIITHACQSLLCLFKRFECDYDNML